MGISRSAGEKFGDYVLKNLNQTHLASFRVHLLTQKEILPLDFPPNNRATSWQYFFLEYSGIELCTCIYMC